MTPVKHRLAIVSAYFWPEKTGISQVTWELASYMAANGVEVDVVTAMPFYPAWEIEQAYRGRIWSTETVNHVHIRRSWHYVAPSPSTVTRLLHEGTLALSAIPNLIRSLRRANHAYIITPQLTFAWVAAIVARVMGVDFTLVVQDVMPDAAVELGMLKSRSMIALSRAMARSLYNRAEEIQTLSEGMRTRIARLCNSADKIVIVPNTIDGDELVPPPIEANEFRRRFVPANTFAVVHTGNMGRKQDLDILLGAANALRDDPSIQFYVFGDGADRERFQRVRDEWGLQNVHHYPLQERVLLPHMLAGADLVLVSQLPEVTDLVVPSKLLTAMGAGAAIVAACHADSEVAKMLNEADGGAVISASKPEELVRAIRNARDNASETLRRRLNARTYALSHFDREEVFSKLAVSIHRKSGASK